MMPSLLILIPLFVIMAINMPLRYVGRRIAFFLAFVLFAAQMVLAVFHHHLFVTGTQGVDPFFKVDLSIDSLGIVALVCMGIVSMASLFVSRYMPMSEDDRFKFKNLLVIMSIGMCGIVMARDIFSLYVFLEIVAVTSFILIAFRRDIYGLEGAFKYLVLSAIATVLMLLSIATILLVAKDTSFTSLAEALKTPGRNAPVVIATAIFLSALFIKGGIFPFHGWLPDAYSASPAPVSILLAGIVTKVAGVYTIMRVVLLFGSNAAINNILLSFGTLSILVGAFAALGQDNFKRMLAYSSVSQVGYIVVGIGAGNSLGIAAAIFHFFNHAMFKSLLFVNSSALEKETGTNNMSRLGGLSERMPVTGATSVVGILSAAGIPPLAGFWSKLMIIIALWQAGRYAYASIAVFAGLVTLSYLLTMQRKVFFGKIKDGLGGVKEAGFDITMPSIAIAAIVVLTGMFFPFIFQSFILPIKDMVLR
jgi:multicomponent Na+:H+ antiporter subunit D